MNEIEAILEKEQYLEKGEWVRTPGVEQALALVREKPEPTEFTKECRALRLKGATEEQWEYADKLGQACIYIDQLQAKLDYQYKERIRENG